MFFLAFTGNWTCSSCTSTYQTWTGFWGWKGLQVRVQAAWTNWISGLDRFGIHSQGWHRWRLILDPRFRIHIVNSKNWIYCFKTGTFLVWSLSAKRIFNEVFEMNFRYGNSWVNLKATNRPDTCWQTHSCDWFWPFWLRKIRYSRWHWSLDLASFAVPSSDHWKIRGENWKPFVFILGTRNFLIRSKSRPSADTAWPFFV